MDPSPQPFPPELLQHGRFVRALARELLRDEHLSEDVAQETWLRWLQRSPLALDPRAWLAAVARNLARNTARAESLRRPDARTAATPPMSPSAASELEHAELLRAVVDEVLALEEPYRTTILCRYYRDWDARKIAEETKTPLATVRSRLQRAHGILREQLDRVHGGRPTWTAALAPLCGLEAATTAASTGALYASISMAAVVLVGAILVVAALRTSPSTASEPVRSTPLASATIPDELADGDVAPIRTSVPDPNAAVAGAARLRISGTVENLPYPDLGLAAGPARHLAVRCRLGRESFFNSGDLGRADAVTDDSGAFAVEIPLPSEAPFHLGISSAADDAYRSMSFDRIVGPGMTAIADLKLSRAAHGILSGRAVDPHGSPVPGALLEIRRLQDPRPPLVLETDAQGEFKTPWRGHPESPRCLTPGLTLLRWDPPNLLESGGSGPLVVTLAKSAALRVRVVDRHGEAIAETRVSVELDPSEYRAIGSSDTGRDKGLHSKTDAHGTAEFDDVWADRKLLVWIQNDVESRSSASCRAGELLFGGDADAGEPIVLQPGEKRELVANWRAELTIAGKVLFPDGRGAPGVDVHARDLGDSSSVDGGTWGRMIRSDPEGSFRVRLVSFEIRGPVQIVAVERPPKTDRQMLSELGYAGEVSPTDGAVGAVMIDPASAVDGLIEVAIGLKPTLSIAGRLFDAKGDPIRTGGAGCGHRLWVVPAGAPPRGPTGEIVPPGMRFDAEGNFHVFGLPERLYDLYVSEELRLGYSFDSFLHRFPGIAAGTEGLEIRLPEREEVHIRVRLHGGEPSGMLVLHGKLFPRDAGAVKRRVAPRELRVADAADWPEGAVFGFAGISGHEDALGSWADGFYSTDETREHDLPPFGPGWYVIGIRPSSDEGKKLWAAQASKPLWFEAGEHTIDFDLVPSGTLEGRLLADATHEHLAVALVDAEGRLLPLESQPGFANPSRILETDARGGFVIRHAPVGNHKLRAGSRAELERGGYRRELKVEIREQDNAPVEIRF